MDPHSLECLDFPRVREIVARYAATSLGRGMALALRPTTRGALIRRWLAQVAELRSLAADKGLPPFGGVHDIREAVRKCAPPLHVTLEDVAQIGETLAATHELTAYFSELPEAYPELRHIAGRIGDFKTVSDRISAVIDERMQVRDDASPKLLRIRRTIGEAMAAIEQVVERLLHDGNVRRLLQFPNHTFFNDRLVLPLKLEYRGRLAGIVHRSSDSGATIYVEPAAAVELNNQITNLRAQESEEIARLLWDLAHEIHINEEAILKTLDALAILDLTIAKVRMAREFRMITPPLVEAPRVNVRAARHPLLLDLVRAKRDAGEPVPEIVPISYRLGDDFDMLIITGPNTGGKTVTLKTIGLLSLMVQAGMPVPVDEGSTFGVFTDVFIDIGDEQSMQQSLSTFSGHLKRQMEMMHKSGGRSLVLLDELGAGTDPDEGAAIGKAVLDEFLRRKSRCIATTHLGALKSYPLQRQRVENGSVEFDVESLRPTYHLLIGEPGMSNAIAIAERLGMPRRVVHNARRNVSQRHAVFHKAMRDTIEAKRQAEEARTAAENARLDLDRRQSEADAAKALFERQQSDFQQWVQRVVHLQPGDSVRVRSFDRDGKIVRVRLDAHRAQVDLGTFSVEVPLGEILPPATPAPPPRPASPPTPPRAKERPSAAPATPQAASPRPEKRRESRGPLIRSLTDEQAAALSPGEIVFVKRFHRTGSVVRVIPARKIALISTGVLEFEVPFSGLATPEAAQQAHDRRRRESEEKPQRRTPDESTGSAASDGL